MIDASFPIIVTFSILVYVKCLREFKRFMETQFKMIKYKRNNNRSMKI